MRSSIVNYSLCPERVRTTSSHTPGVELTRRVPCLLWGTRMRIFSKHDWLMVLGLVLVMAARSCGGTTGSGSTPTTATSAPTTATTPTMASTFTVQTAPATVNRKTITTLTNAQG